MPTGAEATHPLDGVTIRQGVQLGDGSSWARVFVAPPAASYVMSVDNGLVSARGVFSGLRDCSSSDAAYVMQHCITSLGAAGGTIVMLPGSYAWGSIPKLTRNLTGRLSILGSPGTILVMSDGGRRIFDWDKQVDHDVFSNIEIGRFNIDASALSSLTGSHRVGHILIGNYIDGVLTGQGRYNVDRLWVHDIKATGIPTDSTVAHHHQFMWIIPYQAAPGEGTQNYVTNVLVERCYVSGGNQGFVIGGGVIAGPITGTNILVDKITIRDSSHDTGVVPASNWTSSNILIGYHAQVGDVVVDNFYGAGCGDAALEIDCPKSAHVSNTTLRDAENGGFYGTNFNSPIDPLHNKWTFTNCRVEQVACTTAASGWRFFTTGGIRYGQLYLKNCSYLKSVATINASDKALNFANGPYEVHLEGFRADITGWATTGAVGTYRVMEFDGGGVGSNVPLWVTLKNTQLRIAGDLTGGGTINLEPVAAPFDVKLEIDGLTYEDSITALPAGSVKGLQIGYISSSSQQVATRIRRYRFIASVDTTPLAIRVGGTANLTLSRLVIEGCDFSGMAAGGTEVSFAGVTNAPSTEIRECVWKNTPAVSSPADPGTGVAYRNTLGYAVMVYLDGGSITTISHSPDNSVFTQIAGARTFAAVRLGSGEALKLVHAGAPTWRVVPQV